MYRLNVIFLMMISARLLAQEPIEIGKKYLIESQVLKETRSYYVRLPASYEHDDFYIGKKYPVMIVLDGDSHFQLVSGMMRAMSENDEQIPEMIVVAVPNTNRQRDLTPDDLSLKKNEPFLDFLEKELLPKIDQAYRTIPYKVLVGHSMAGLFSLNCFLRKASFNAYVAIDPTLRWKDDAIVKQSESVLSGNKDLQAAVYVSQSGNPLRDVTSVDTKAESFKTFISYLDKNASAKLRHHFDSFSEEDHFSVPLQSLYRGLLFVFEGYKFPLSKLVNDPHFDIAKHYAAFQNTMGVKLLPPGKLIDQVGMYCYGQKKIDKSFELLKLNESYYDSSYQVYQNLGVVYAAANDKQRALASFRKSLALRPDNDVVKGLLSELEKKE